MMKRILAVLLSLTMVAASLMGCGKSGTTTNESAANETVKEENAEASDSNKGPFFEREFKEYGNDPKIALILPTIQAEFFITIGDTASEIWEEEGYTDFSVYSYEGDAAKAIEIVENCITDDVDIIEIMVTDNAVDDALRQAMEAGIAVISLGVENGYYDYCNIADNYDCGVKVAEMTADWVNEHFDGATQIAAITCYENENMSDRSNGLIETLKELLPNSEIVTEITVKNTVVGEGSTGVENLLQRFPDCQVIASYSDLPAVEAVEVYKAAGKVTENTAIFASDATQQAIEEIAAGDILRGTVSMGDIAVNAANYVIQWVNGELEQGLTFGENVAITIDNAEEFLN